MSVHIVFDQVNKYYTNLDFVTGRVVLYLHNDTQISAITVKLEAESRTRLQGPKYENDKSEKKRTELEVHKLLYKVQTVFPTPTNPPSAFTTPTTLTAGQYEYPFQFKLPFNNDCMNNNRMIKDLKLGQLNVQLGPDMNRHIKKTLPPTLSGFPGEAEIKYYVKATVVRRKFYQENFRYQVDIKFLPIEPPRPPDRQEETYARRKQHFQRQSAPQKKGLFRKSSTPAIKDEEDQLEVQIDARLPNPAIITCNQPLPLRVLVHKLSDPSAHVILSMLQIELFGYTKVRAHDLTREETSNWLLMSQANMDMPLQRSPNKEADEWLVPPNLWSHISLPNDVAPSFSTCNITRQYELEVRVGLSQPLAESRPEVLILPLRLPVTVYSGIAPPAQLLIRMSRPHATAEASPTSPATLERPSISKTSSTTTPLTPSSTDFDPSPAQLGTYHLDPEDYPEEAPPSYEDAMADDLAPVDGPRPGEYNVPTGDPDRQNSDFSYPSDSKSGLVRRVSERLFSSNAPMSPSRRVSSHNASSSPIREDEVASADFDQQYEGVYGAGYEERPELPLRRSTQEKAWQEKSSRT